MNKPRFLIIGAYRCGTTSLYNHICQHPLVNSAKVKELNYFSRYYHRDLKWYYSQFPKDCITGEASPSYMPCEQAVYNIKSDLHNIKIIAILRNPADRLLSHVNYFGDKAEQALKYGYYAKQLKPYVNLFDDVLVLQSEKYFDNEWNILQKVFEFLNLPCSGIKIKTQQKNVYTANTNYQWLTDYYESYNDDLWDLLGEKWNW